MLPDERGRVYPKNRRNLGDFVENVGEGQLRGLICRLFAGGGGDVGGDAEPLQVGSFAGAVRGKVRLPAAVNHVGGSGEHGLLAGHLVGDDGEGGGIRGPLLGNGAILKSGTDDAITEAQRQQHLGGGRFDGDDALGGCRKSDRRSAVIDAHCSITRGGG